MKKILTIITILLLFAMESGSQDTTKTIVAENRSSGDTIVSIRFIEPVKIKPYSRITPESATVTFENNNGKEERNIK